MQDDFDDDLTVAFRPTSSTSGDPVSPPIHQPDDFDDDVTVGIRHRDPTNQAETGIVKDSAAPAAPEQYVDQPRDRAADPVGRLNDLGADLTRRPTHESPRPQPLQARPVPSVPQATQRPNVPSEPALRPAPAGPSAVWTPPTRRAQGPDGPSEAPRGISPAIIIGIVVSMIVGAVLLYLVFGGGTPAAFASSHVAVTR